MFAFTTLARAGLTIGLVLSAVSPAGADLVRLTNGRTLAVHSARFDGDIIVLRMASGQDVHVSRALVESVVPTGVASARVVALDALATSPTAAAPRPGTGAIRELVDRVARRVGLDSRLAHAVVRAESNYDPLAVSTRGAMGLMQIMPPVAGAYAVRDPYDPEQNLEAGMRHLLELMQRFGMTGALAAYNAGAGAVRRWGGVPPYRETQYYVQRILTLMQ